MKNSKFLTIIGAVVLAVFAMSCEDSTLDELQPSNQPVRVLQGDDNQPEKESPNTPVVRE